MVLEGITAEVYPDSPASIKFLASIHENRVWHTDTDEGFIRESGIYE
jgi:hypothetical protein